MQSIVADTTPLNYLVLIQAAEILPNLYRIHRRVHSNGCQEFALRGPCFIAVFLRVQIERRLNLRVTQDSLNGLGLDFRLVHQPVA